MKIAITATGESMDSPVDPRFGRAAWFVLVDTETGERRAVENAAGRDAGHGAGLLAAQIVSKLGADWLLTGECGPKAWDALKTAGINVRSQTAGTVAEAVKAFLDHGAIT